ncbi:MAG TPA: diguanylate cyclase [Gallionella sp.]|nr:diguanylate cyclase [Gallionella sp.]
MTSERTKGHPALIVGAGRGGSALLEMFMEDDLVRVVAMVDTNAEAPGLQLAKKYGIPTYTDPVAALQACKDYPDCIVYNLSHDDTIAEQASKVFGDKRVASGPEVKLFWQMVTNLKQVKGELEKSQLQLQSVIHNVMDGIITTDESGAIQGFNPAAENIFGYSQEEITGQNIRILMPESDRSGHDVHVQRYLKSGDSQLLGMRNREVTSVRKNGETFSMEISISEMTLGGQKYFVAIVRDITERKKAEEKIAHLAHYDFLTDLPNRAMFMNTLGHSMLLAKRNGYKVAALFLDLDGFKQVNDTLGHDAGDLLLQGVAKRLQEVIRASDTVARVGGDEFTFVLNGIDSEEDVATIARKLIATLSEPFDLQGRQCHVGGSIGASLFPDSSGDMNGLIKQADEAMYLAKQSGKNTYKFYREVLQARAGQ